MWPQAQEQQGRWRPPGTAGGRKALPYGLQREPGPADRPTPAPSAHSSWLRSGQPLARKPGPLLPPDSRTPHSISQKILLQGVPRIQPGPAPTISPGWSPARPQQRGPSQLPSYPSLVPALRRPLTSLRVKAHICPRPPGPACPLAPRGSFTACPFAFPPWLQCHLSLRPPLISKFKCDGKMERPDHCKAPSGMPGSDSAAEAAVWGS